MVDPVIESRHDTSIPAHERSTELDHKGRTRAERHALFMTGFTNILQHEGLRSPRYYEDKSQCISFQDCSPAEMGIIKAERLKWGYVDPKELAKRLQQLKPSHNFTLRKYRPPQMLWEKSPIPATPRIVDFPDADWVSYQEYGIRDLKRRLGDSLTKTYLDEVQKYWNRVRDIELNPVPDIYLLTHINHSPSGTLFPRYLVKALWELLDSTHKKGLQHYYDKLNQGKRKREKIICQWQAEHPSEILADDALSIYRTWPAELMARLDEVDREVIREGRKLYIAELEKTGQKMQELVAFWKNCGLITGTRTPLSPQWPDPKAKLRGVYKPMYLWERLHPIRTEFGYGSNEGEKRTMIENARWKEAVLNTDTDPMISELPLTQPLLQKLEVVWKDWEDHLDDEYVEDAMINVFGRWRKEEEDEPCLTASSSPEPNSCTDMPCLRISRSDTRALTDGLGFLQKHPLNKRKSWNGCGEPARNNATQLGRLRPKIVAPGVRRQVRDPEKPRKGSQHIVKPRGSKPRGSKPSARHPSILQAGKARVGRIPAISPPSSELEYSPIVTQQKMPCTVKSTRMAEQHPTEEIKNDKLQSFLQGVSKSSNAKWKSPSKRRRSGSDKNTEKFLRILTPPTSE